MREAQITLPCNDNAGNNLDAVKAETVARLIALAGGCTVRPATGYWQDGGGKLYREPVNELVAALADTPANADAIRAIARGAGHAARQQAMYVRLPDGTVEIIDTSSAGKVAA